MKNIYFFWGEVGGGMLCVWGMSFHSVSQKLGVSRFLMKFAISIKSSFTEKHQAPLKNVKNSHFMLFYTTFTFHWHPQHPGFFLSQLDFSRWFSPELEWMTTAIIKASNLSIFASIQIAILWYKTQRASAAWIYIDFSRMKLVSCTEQWLWWKTAGFSFLESSSLGKVWKLNEFFFLSSETGENVRFVMTLSSFFHTSQLRPQQWKARIIRCWREKKENTPARWKYLGAELQAEVSEMVRCFICEKLSEKFFDKAFLVSVCLAD